MSGTWQSRTRVPAHEPGGVGDPVPLLARDAFNGDAQVASSMFVAMGSGAVIGVLAVAGVLEASTGRLIISCLVFEVLLVAAAVAPAVSDHVLELQTTRGRTACRA